MTLAKYDKNNMNYKYKDKYIQEMIWNHALTPEKKATKEL